MTGGLNINTDLKPVEYAPKCKTPAFFIHGIDDDFVEMSHTEKNMSAYGSDQKEENYCQGGHNDERPAETIENAIKFFKKYLV